MGICAQSENYMVTGLPGNGIIGADTCGLNWVPDRFRHKDKRFYYEQTIKKVSGFNATFRERGGRVLSPPLILSEIENCFNHCQALKNKIITASGGDLKSSSNYDLFDRVLEATDPYYSRLSSEQRAYKESWNFLSRGWKKYEFRNVGIDPKDVDARLDRFKGLDLPERELILKMIVLGDGNGILGADDKSKDAYFGVAGDLGLRNCFYCDSSRGRLFSLK